MSLTIKEGIILQLYDKDRNPIWLYQYTEGSEDGISILLQYYSTREISVKERVEAYQEYEKYRKRFYKENPKGWPQIQTKYNFLKEKFGLVELELEEI
jgi:hypothetical protein